MSLITSPAAQSDLFSGRDINTVIDSGCLKSVGGEKSAAALAFALVVDFIHRELDFKPFFHSYGPSCSEASLVFAIWDMPNRDLNDKDAVISFYITPGDSFLLLGNNILQKYDQMGDEKVMKIPDNSQELVFPTYMKDRDDGYLRT